jgi:predicted enzyme related to lactoylglutathione lyase
MMAMNEDFFGPEIPSHWASAFAVADCDAILDSARELGARVTFGPIDSAIGRFANVIDPQGAAFSIMQPPPQG